MTAWLAGLLPRLNERDRRLALGAEAKSWGYGGIEEVHQATGVARSTIKRGIRDLEEKEVIMPACAGTGDRMRIGAAVRSRRRRHVVA